MMEAAPTRGMDWSCTLLVTVVGFADDWVASDTATEWATNIVRKAVRESDHNWEGDLLHAIPLNSTVAGKRFKLKFVGVPELLIAEIVMPAFEKLGQVKKVSIEEDRHTEGPKAQEGVHRLSVMSIKSPLSWKNSSTCEAMAEAT